MARPKVETLKHREMFESYYWLGDQRSYSIVARQFKVTPTAVANASQAFGWPARVQDRDKLIAAKLEQRNNASILKMKERHLKISRATQIRYAQRLGKPDESGNLVDGATRYEPNTSDAIRAMQHELLIEGQPTARAAVTIGAPAIEGLVSAILDVLRRKIPHHCPACSAELSLPETVGRALLEVSATFSANPTDAPVIDAEAIASPDDSPHGTADAAT